MRDVTGFALLLIVMVVLLYLLVQFVLPFIVTWLLGVVTFFVLASVLLRGGRVHPRHLDSYLKPRVGLAIGLMAVAAPAVHAGCYALFAERADLWWLVLVLNAGPALIWWAHLVNAHRRQRILYFAEGHDIEDMLDRATARDAALEVRSDALESLAAHHHEPEPWELVAGGQTAGGIDLRPEIARAITAISALRAAHAGPVGVLQAALAAVRAGQPVPVAEVEAARTALDRMEPDWDRIMNATEALLAEAVSGVIPGWEEEPPRTVEGRGATT